MQPKRPKDGKPTFKHGIYLSVIFLPHPEQSLDISGFVASDLRFIITDCKFACKLEINAQHI